jgi:hypothetical protein
MNNSINPRQRNFVVGLIVIGLMIIGFFGLRTVRAFRQFHGHRPPPPFTGEKVETNVDLVRDWMTLPYISIAYRLPPNMLYETLKIPPKGSERKSLKELNDEYYPEAPGIVIELVKAAIRAHQPAPTAFPADTVVPAVTSVPPVAP